MKKILIFVLLASIVQGYGATTNAMKCFRAYRSYNQTTAVVNVYYTSKFDAEIIDTENSFNTTTHEYTISDSGRWLVVVRDQIQKLDNEIAAVFKFWQVTDAGATTNELTYDVQRSFTADGYAHIKYRTIKEFTVGDRLYAEVKDQNVIRDTSWGSGTNKSEFSAVYLADRPCFIAHRSYDQDNPSGSVWYDALYDVVDYDGEGGFALNQYTIPKTGWWLINNRESMYPVSTTTFCQYYVYGITDAGATTNDLSFAVFRSGIDNSWVGLRNATLTYQVEGDVIYAQVRDTAISRFAIRVKGSSAYSEFSGVYLDTPWGE